jgi:hypothetical protein
VRVVGQQRLAGRGVLAVDDPAVGPEPVPLAEERRQPVDPPLDRTERVE